MTREKGDKGASDRAGIGMFMQQACDDCQVDIKRGKQTVDQEQETKKEKIKLGTTTERENSNGHR